jgi:hypothetical protein
MLCFLDFVDAYVRNAINQGEEHDKSLNDIWSNGENNEPSDEFVSDMDTFCKTMKWRSKNYRIISEYSNSMSLSDSSIEQLLLLVSITTVCIHKITSYLL